MDENGEWSEISFSNLQDDRPILGVSVGYKHLVCVDINHS